MEPVMLPPDVDLFLQKFGKYCHVTARPIPHVPGGTVLPEMFCQCFKTENCKNPLTVRPNEEDENEEGEQVSED